MHSIVEIISCAIIEQELRFSLQCLARKRFSEKQIVAFTNSTEFILDFYILQIMTDYEGNRKIYMA